MKLYKRLLSVLLVCLLLFVPFSTVAHADNKYDLNALHWAPAQADSNYSYISSGSQVFPLSNPTRWKTSRTETIQYPQYLMFEYTPNTDKFNTASSTIVVPKGDGFSLSLDNFYDSIVYYDANGNEISTRSRNYFTPQITVELFDISGGFTSIIPDDYTSSVRDGRISFSVDVNEVPFDVYRFRIVLYESSFPFGGSRPSSYSSWARVMMFDSYSSHSVKSIPEEKGLLKSIIEWLKSIGGGIEDVFNSITELPSKIWGFIENGLKSLFVPDEQYMTQYSNKWDLLLSNRFGALYQVGGVIADFGQSVLTALNSDDEQNIIEFPEITIPLGKENFTFGGWTVRFKVDKFDIVYDTLWIITGALGTFLFVNGLRKRYDSIMGGA